MARRMVTDWISIHAPHARGDPPNPTMLIFLLKFQSTPLMRGATWLDRETILRKLPFQSTPLMRGATLRQGRLSRSARDFNPRPSCEGRRGTSSRPTCRRYFNPRPSCEGRLVPHGAYIAPSPISIHAPHARGDLPEGRRTEEMTIFQSTPLMRGATARTGCRLAPRRISIHAPHARGDAGRGGHGKARCISIHAPHARGDGDGPCLQGQLQISIHAPHARGDHQQRFQRRKG